MARWRWVAVARGSIDGTVVRLVAAVVALYGAGLIAGAADTARGGAAAGTEVRELRTPTSSTFRAGNGRKRTVIETEAIHFAADQSFERVTTALGPLDAAAGIQGYAFGNRANGFRTSFKPSLARGFLRVATGGSAVDVSLEGAAPVLGALTSAGVRYGNAHADTDLEYRGTAAGVKELLTLRSQAAPATLRFRFDPLPGRRLEAARLDSGALRLTLDDGEALTIEPPYAVDARADLGPGTAGAPAADRSPHMTMTHRPSGTGYVVELRVDEAWLRNPRRRFPVVIDPSITLQSAATRAEFPQCSGCVGVDRGDWRVGSDGSTAYRSAFRFDFSAIPAGARVVSARFDLPGSCLKVGTTCPSTQQVLNLHRLTSSWGPGTASSALQFDADPLDSYTTIGNAPSQTASWSHVSSLVADWVAGTARNDGFLVKAASEALSRGGLWSGTARLEVVWSDQAAQLAEPVTLHANGAELEWRKPGAFIGGAFDRYEVHRSQTAGFTPSAQTLIATIRDPDATTFRDTTAAPDKRFSYKVLANGQTSVERRVRLPEAGFAETTVTTASSGGADTFLVEGSCANHGGSTELEVAGGPIRRRALLRFELPTILRDAQIATASLQLHVTGTTGIQGPILPSVMRTAWNEGYGRYGACFPVGATWTESDAGQPWQTPGGDAQGVGGYYFIPSGTGWTGVDVRAEVLDWVREGPNLGLMLKYNTESGSEAVMRFAAGDSAPDRAPRLKVRWHEDAPIGKPAVAVTAPAPDAMERGAVALKAEAADDQRIDRVEFRIDGAVLSSDTSAPYEATWSTAAAQNGQHQVTARAIDDAGNETTSDPVQFRVGNSQAPTAAITSHADRYDALVKQDAPIAYWRLDETTGTTAADASGNGRYGIYTYTYLLGTAPLFTGSGSSVTFKNATTDGRMTGGVGSHLAGPMTAEAWYDSAGVTTAGAYNRLVSRGWGAPGGWMLALHKATSGYPLAVWSINKAGTVYTAQAVLPSGRHHIAGTYDGNVARLFLDGVEYASTTVGAVTLTTTSAVAIGETLDTDIVVDEVAVYSRALSQQALARHHELGANGRLKVTGDVPVTAAAADDGTVQRVEFLLDGSLVAEDTAAPFETTLQTLDQAAPIYDGRHAIVARAYDNHEQYTESAPVELDVANASDAYRARIEELTLTPESVEYDPARGSDQLDHGIDVRVTNTSSSTWAASDVALRPVWRTPDPEGTDVPGAAVALPAVAPGQSVDRTVTVEAPALPPGIERARYTLEIDAQRTATGQSFAPKGNKPLAEPVNVDKATTVEQGLERYYQYDGEDVGAGMVHLLNVASGNSVLRWTPFEAPGRGLSTVVDLTYNALEQKSESPVGNNFSLAISGLTRFGNPIDIHPNDADRKGGRPESKYVEIVDGDGTLHRFSGRTAPDGSTYFEEPPGVNLYLRALPVGDPNGRWAFTRPDRVTFYYDADGYPLSVADANGNRVTYTLENTPPGEDPGGPKKRITRVTDAGGRSFTITYYSKADAKQAHVRGNIARISDHDGKGSLEFEYYKDGNLHRLIQRGGPRPDGRLVPDRSFTFAYTTSAGNGPATNTNAQSTRIYSVRDPRGGETRFSYLGSGNGNDRWKLESRTDRSGALTSYTYDTATRLTTVSAPEARVTKYRYDATGQPTAITNPLNETTTLTWTPDRQVSDVVEPGAGDVPQRTQHYEYNANGYLTKAVDEENETTELTYENFPAAAGDPGTHVSDLKTVKNPRGFTHTYFYDENQLYTGRRGNVSKVVDPLGHATEFKYNLDGTVAYTEDQRDKRTTIPEYDLNGLPRQIVDATNRAVRFSHDADGRLEWVQDAVHGSFATTGGCSLHGARERDWRTCFDYDAFGRLVRVSEPKSTEHDRGELLWSSAVHDANDNVVETEAPHLAREDTRGPSISTAGFDAMDRVRFEVGPDRSAGEERVTYDYDTAGRMTKVTSPRGTQTTATNDFATTLTYDKLDRVVMETRERTDPGRLATLRTHFCYDIAGDLRSVTRPRAQVPLMTCAPGAPAGTSHTSRYKYFPDGELERAIDPLGHFRRWTYDANDNVDESFDKAGTPAKRHYNNRDEVVQIDRMLTADKTVSTKFEYDPAGNLLKQLSSRAVDTGSTTNYVTSFAYDDANRLTRTIMPVGPNSRGSADPVQAAYQYRQYDPNGRVAMVSLPSTASSVDGLTDNEKTQATYWDPGWVRTTNAPGAPRQSYDYTPEGWQAKRRAEGKDGSWREMEWTYFLDGTLQRHEGRTNEEDLSFNQYTYDLNNNVRTALISVGTHDPEGEPRDLTVEWDTLDQLSKVVETPRNRVDLYEHDLNGNLASRVDDAILGQEGTTGHRHDYTYDGRDKMDFHLDLGRKRGDAADDRDVDVEYTPTGWVASRTVRSREAGVMRGRQRMDWTYFLNGLKKTVETRKGSDPTSEVVESHTLSYLEGDDYLNGHRVTDTFKVLGPEATAKCRTTNCTRTYTYDARDRVIAESRTDGPSASYSFDAPGNLESKTIDGETDRFRYEGTRVIEQLTGTGELFARYRHDAFGNLDCVTNRDVALADMETVCDDIDGETANDGLLQRNRYDALDRLRLGQRFAGGELQSRSRYAYDPLNRPIRREERSTDPESEKTGTRRFLYVGLSRSVSRETWNPVEGGEDVAKEYSYDADGTRVAFTAQRGNESVRELTYGYNAHGDVSLVLDGNGTAKASYGYLAFGDEDKGLTKEKEFDSEADAKPNDPTNAYRYTGKSLDPDTGTLDMGARRFSPEIGGFLQADQFDDALSNLGLSTDPLTGNRYSLAAGNPVSFVEVDGHIPAYDNVEEAKDAADVMREFGKHQMEQSSSSSTPSGTPSVAQDSPSDDGGGSSGGGSGFCGLCSNIAKPFEAAAGAAAEAASSAAEDTWAGVKELPGTVGSQMTCRIPRTPSGAHPPCPSAEENLRALETATLATGTGRGGVWACQKLRFCSGAIRSLIGGGDDAAKAGFAGLSASGRINPTAVRFSQSSISRKFKDGGTIDDLAEGLKTGRVDPTSVPPVRLVEREGLTFTLDNRRLEAFRRAGVDIPYVKATPEEAAAEAWKFTTRNQGTSIQIRGG